MFQILVSGFMCNLFLTRIVRR
ncbi:unnamed protein product, partial [Rotaria sp. Silwood2]